MIDILTKEQRSTLMSKVRSSNTKPELLLRRALHRLGYRYTLNNKTLPGNPDLVFPKYRTVVFVHGCFWHRHARCKRASMPKSNEAFWIRKFSENVLRDRRVKKSLKKQGWNVIVVWECELLKRSIETIERTACEIAKNQVECGKPS